MTCTFNLQLNVLQVLFSCSSEGQWERIPSIKGITAEGSVYIQSGYSTFHRIKCFDVTFPNKAVRFTLLQPPERRMQQGGGWSLLPGKKRQDERKQSQVAPEEVKFGYKEKFLHQNGVKH